MRTAITSLLILATLSVCGCKTMGIKAKREEELCCPTDIRKTVPWCAGEDALFQCPCQPDATYYGYKPTCWGVWPTSGAVWRDSHCGSVHHGAILNELTNRNPELIMLPTTEPQPDTIPEAPQTPTSEEEKAEESLPELDLGAANYKVPVVEIRAKTHQTALVEHVEPLHCGQRIR